MVSTCRRTLVPAQSLAVWFPDVPVGSRRPAHRGKWHGKQAQREHKCLGLLARLPKVAPS